MSSSGMSSMSRSETAVGLEEGVGLSTGRRCSLNWSFSRRFVSPYVLFVAMSAVYHVDEVFGIAIDMIRDGSSFPSQQKM